MPAKSLSQIITIRWSAVLIASVWIFHGLFSKIMAGIPRHQMIVARILGEQISIHATIAIGVLEILLGCWVISGLFKKSCATVQTTALVSMNTLEVIFAREILISATGMIFLNLCFIAIIWHWALKQKISIQPTDLRKKTNSK